MRWLRLWFLQFRADALKSQIAHGEGLLRDHRLRLDNCQAELSVIERRINIAHLTGRPQPLINQALKRRTA